MTFKPGLTNINPAAPALWALYAHVTLLRCTGYGTPELLQAWNDWAGGTSFAWEPPTSTYQSSVTVAQDGVTAILAYEGTRNFKQLVGQIIASGQVSAAPAAGNVSAFDLWVANGVNPSVLAHLGGLPTGSPALVIGHSLGGALAMVTTSQLEKTGRLTPESLVTFGQPRTGDDTFGPSLTTPYTRVVATNDPVPNVPPTNHRFANYVHVVSQAQVGYFYEHPNLAWIVDPLQFTRQAGPDRTGTLSWQVAMALATGVSFGSDLFFYHFLGTYANSLHFALLETTGYPNLSALVALNQQLDVLDGATYGPQPPLPVLPSPGVFGDPQIAIAPTPGPPIIPVQDVGGMVESRQIAIVGVRSFVIDGILPGVIPMAVYGKCTFFYAAGTVGWSETWWTNAASGTPDAILPAARTLANARLALSGVNTFLQYIRITLVNVPLLFPSPARQTKLFVINPQAGAASGYGATDAPEVAMILRLSPNVAGAPPKLVYIRGIPDAYVTNAGNPVSAPNIFFGSNWTAFVNQLVGTQWGWGGKSTGAVPPQLLASLTQNAGGTISFTTNAPGPFGFIPAGSIVPVRFSKIQTPGNLNGVHPIVVSGPTAGTTAKRIAMLPWSNNGFAAYNGFGITQISKVDFLRIGERKTGRPFAPPRGRARVRPTA